MFDQTVYWMWLQQAFGVGSAKPVTIGKRFKNLEEFYKGGVSLWCEMDFITDKELNTLLTYKPEMAYAHYEYCQKIGNNIITYADEEYPQKLREINSPPAVLYYKGEFCEFDEKLVVSVVGSRNIDQKTKDMTHYICYELARAGAIVTSGGALGSDSAAHYGAIHAGEPTVCVQPCSLDYPYLMSNINMRNQILENKGMLLSENSVNTGVNKGSFLIRNRIISGLSDAVFAVRAKKKSGTMLTVAHAVRQNKDLYAFPGDVNDESCEGTNELIRDGATPVLSAEDILCNYYHILQNSKIGPKHTLVSSTKKSKILSQSAKIVYNSIGEKIVHISKIAMETGLKTAKIQAAITELEMEDLVQTYSGQRVSIKK